MSDVEPVNGIDDLLPVDEVTEEDQSDQERLVICEDSSGMNGAGRSGGVAPPITPTRNGPIQNRTYSCNQCLNSSTSSNLLTATSSFSTTSARAYLFHMKEVHNDGSPIYTCDICEYATKYKQKLPRHRKLHFEGPEVPRTVMSQDTNDSRSSGHMGDRMVEPEDDEDLHEIEAVEEEIEEPGHLHMSHVEPPKKKGTRQEVDPAKYFEVKDEDALKFACSTCGNMYKWRKSLNKHWKEKHAHDEPDSNACPRGMRTLIQQGSIRKTGDRRAVKIGPTNQTTSPNQGRDSGGSTPVSALDSQFSNLQVLPPNMLGLLAYNGQSTSQPVFPGNPGMLVVGNHPVFSSILTPASETPRDLEQSEPQGGPLDLSNKATEVSADVPTTH